MNHVEMLRAAKALISDKANWITGNYAKADDNRTVPANHPEACKFCAVGALAHVGDVSARQIEHETEVGVFLNQAARESNRLPHSFNDEDGHGAVMAMYDRAIALAEASSLSATHRGSPE